MIRHTLHRITGAGDRSFSPAATVGELGALDPASA